MSGYLSNISGAWQLDMLNFAVNIATARTVAVLNGTTYTWEWHSDLAPLVTFLANLGPNQVDKPTVAVDHAHVG
jgi:hypothetical protein